MMLSRILASVGALLLADCAQASGVTVRIPNLGLTLQASAGTKVEALGRKFLVRGPDFALSVALASKFSPETIAAALKEAKDLGPQNVREEKLPDGWALLFENTGSAGKNYWVQTRRTMGGRAITCDSTQSTPAQQANALAACKSLKPE
jgi:hypothetical protein